MLHKFKVFVAAALVCVALIAQPIQQVFAHGTSSMPVVTCGVPSVSVSNQGGHSFTFNVQSASGTNQYKYVNKSTGFVSGVFTIGNGNSTVSGLPDGNYTFYFRSVCGDEPSEYVVIDDLITF